MKRRQFLALVASTFVLLAPTPPPHPTKKPHPTATPSPTPTPGPISSPPLIDISLGLFGGRVYGRF